MSLTDTAIRNTKPGVKPIKLFDERGLYLELSPTGGKWWRLKYRFDGKEKRLSLGVYPDVSLKDARDRRDTARKLLRMASILARTAWRRSLPGSTNQQTVLRWWHGSGSPSIPHDGRRITAGALSSVSSGTSSPGSVGALLPT